MKSTAIIIAEKENRLEQLKDKKEQLESDLQDLEESNQEIRRTINNNEAKLKDLNYLLFEILNTKKKLGKNLALNLFIIIILLIIFFAANQVIALYIALVFTVIKTPTYLSLLIKIGVTKEKKFKKEALDLKHHINDLIREGESYKNNITRVNYAISDIETEMKVINDIKEFILETQMPQETQELMIEPEQELISGIELKRMKPRI